MDITSKDRRALMILGAVAVAALVLFVFVVHKGKSSSPTSPAAVSGSQQSPSPQPSPSSHGTKTSSHKSHHSHPVVLQARDPFKPLVTDSPAPAASAPAPSPSPSPPPPPNPAPSPPPSNGNFPASIQLSGHALTLDGLQQPWGGSKHPMPPMILLTVRRRRTGRAYTMPVGMFRRGGSRWLFAQFGDVNWARNLAGDR